MKSRLEIYDTVTGKSEIVLAFDKKVEAPNWTRDGRALIFNSEGALYRLDLETKAVTKIDTGFADQCINDHVLSPDGKSIALTHLGKEDGLMRIYTVPIEGGTPVLLTENAPSYAHGWSYDGGEITFCAVRDGEADIYVIPVAGGEEKRLTTEGFNDGSEYGACGNHIWFMSDRTGRNQIFKMKRDGSAQTQITFDEQVNVFPHPAPDRSAVAYISYPEGDYGDNIHRALMDIEIRLMKPDGTDVRTAVRRYGGLCSLTVHSWSPDAKRFAFASYERE